MIHVDYKDRRPIYEQVIERLQDMMARGVMEEGEQLPSVRSLATDLAINPNTIQRAYAELERQGYIYSVKGKGSFVAESRKIKELIGRELFEGLKATAAQAKELGIAKERLYQEIDAAYGETTMKEEQRI